MRIGPTKGTPSGFCRWIRITTGVLLIILSIGGCGATRKAGLSKDDPGQYRYDEKLGLQLVEIINNKSGQVNLRDPVSVETGTDGGLLVLEQSPARIIALDSNRQIVREVSSSMMGSGGLQRPRFVRSGFGLTVNVADLSGRVLVYDSQLRLISTFEPAYEASDYPIGSPSGIAVSNFGDTYLADRDNDVVYHFDPGGKFVETIGDAEAGAGSLTRPEGLVVAADGSLLVCDTDAQRIVVFDRDGEFLQSIGDGELTAPVCVALTPDEQAVFVGDRQDGRLDLYSITGRWLTSWDGVELTPEGVRRITDLRVARMFLYLVDAGHKQILKFRLQPSGR